MRAGSRAASSQDAVRERAVTGPLNSAEVHELVAAAAKACHLRLMGVDKEDAEHRMQARLRPSHLGLIDWRRELPADRPSADGGSKTLAGKRGYIDFLGVKGKTLHVIETKIGPDDFLVLQGLDYWTWVMGQRDRLAVLYALPTTAPKVALDLVVACNEKGQCLSAYSAAQVRALDGQIEWRFHIVERWDGEEPAVRSWRPRELPGDSIAQA